MSRVNLYIEDTEVKVLVTSGNRVEKWASLVLDPGMVDQGMIQEPDQVSEAIKKLFDLQKIGRGDVVLGMSGLNSLFRNISIPEVGKNLIPEAVSNEAARTLPVPMHQIYHTYQILPSAKGELRVFVAAYPRQSTDTLISTVKKAGLRPVVIEPAPLALARCVDLPRAIIVNSWQTFLDIIVMVEQVPQVIRSVSLPIDSPELEDRVPAVVEEVQRTLTFYNASGQGLTLEKTVPIVVSGDLARLEQTWKPLERLGYPLQTFKPPMDYKPAFNPSQYAVNCGLAMKGKKTPGNYSIIDINALPESYTGPAFNWGRVLIPVGLVAAAAALGWQYLVVDEMKKEAGRLESQQITVVQDINRIRIENDALKASIKKEQAASEPFPAQLSQIEKRAALAGSQEVVFTGIMDDFGNSLSEGKLCVQAVVALCPPEIVLTNMKTEGGVYQLTGRAEDDAIILNYCRELIKTGYFTNVRIDTINSIQETADSPVLRNFLIIAS
jgi:type IV pilus assembly protein PilM